jgi:hypothetical protein
MKPVATFGTSRARTADSASALSAAVAARMRMSFRLVIGLSGMTRQRAPAIDDEAVRAARRIWKSP